VVDVSALDVGAVVHLSALQLPTGCTSAVRDRDLTVVTITGRGIDKATDPEPAAAPAAAAPAKKGDKK
jgi:large subunit ribosomal protein L25